MITLPFSAGGGYNVYIGSRLLGVCGDLISRSVPKCRIAVITDSNVAKLYLDEVCLSLADAGYSVTCYVFPAGEDQKNLSTLEKILEFLAESGFDRSDCVAALGGGVVGDMAGMAAGLYMRGIRYVQLPTTLLADVDSSVGGKTAVDLRSGKNLAGLFKQPEAVICSTDCLGTLSDDVFADGAAEVIKTGILSGEALFSLVEHGISKDDVEDIIVKCIEYKSSIVSADEFDTGMRRALNLGHTVGHAIEKISGYSISHGRAVAIGTSVIARACSELGICGKEISARIENALSANNLPVKCPYSIGEIVRAAYKDKKLTKDGLCLILPEDIGAFRMENVSMDRFGEIVRLGLEAGK